MERDDARRTDPLARDRGARVGLWLVLAVALLARLAVVLSDPYGIAGPDAGEWASTAEYIRSEGEFPRHRGSPTLPYPLYPLLLAGTLSLGHDTGILVAKLVNVAAGVLAALLACRIAGRFASPRVATLAGWAVALHPALVHYAGALSTDSIFVPLLLGVLLGAARLLERPTAGRGAALGVLMALAALQRPSSAAASAGIAVVVAVVLLVRTFSNWRALLAATVAAVLVLAPWTTYLTVRFGETILLSDAWGYAYWDGHHPINARVDDVEDPAERERLSAVKHEEMRRIGASARDRGLSPIETARAYRDAAEEHIAAGRVSRAGATASNLTHLLAFWPNPAVRGTKVAMLFGAYLIPLTLLGAWGLLRSLWSRNAALALCALTAIAVCVAQSALLVGLIRYRFAHIDPILALGVPVAAAGLLARLRRGRDAAPAPQDERAPTGSRAATG